MFIVDGQSLFDYNRDSDESSEHGIVLVRFCSIEYRLSGNNWTPKHQIHYTKQLDPRSLFRSSIMRATLSSQL